MKTEYNKKDNLLSATIDLGILLTSFLLASSLLSSSSLDIGLSEQALLFASIVTLSIQFVKALVPKALFRQSTILRSIIGSAIGVLIGALIFNTLCLYLIIPIGATTIVASFISFFVLGTISPIMHRKYLLKAKKRGYTDTTHTSSFMMNFDFRNTKREKEIGNN